MGGQVKTGANLESLMNALASRDGVTRLKARESLVALGRPAVLLLIRALRGSKVDQVRWEAAKTLGAIGDARAVPALVKALEDTDPDVAWLAAEALQKLGKAAWPTLLRALIRCGARSSALRQGAHHVFRGQRQEGLDDLITRLLKALEDSTVPELTLTAAHDFLEKVTAPSRRDRESFRMPKAATKAP